MSLARAPLFHRRSVATLGMVFLVVATTSPTPLSGQETKPAASPPIRVSNYSVAVDVVVTDKRNRYVKDLNLDDFVLEEDGVVQEIQSLDSTYDVQPEAREAAEADSPTLSPGTFRSAADTPPSRLNLVIFLLDFATIEHSNQTYVRQAAQEFVRDRMRPSDLVAVFAVDSGLRFLQGFTGDRDALQEALDTWSGRGTLNASDQANLNALAQNAQDQAQTLTSQIQSLGATGGGSQAAAAQIQILAAQLSKTQALEGLFHAQLSYSREQQSRPVIGAIQTIADGVEHLAGRKTLVLFSQGFSVPGSIERSLYRAVERANRSNLAIYAIDAGGLQARYRNEDSELHDISANRAGDRVKAYGGLSLFDRAREVGSDQQESTLRYLATSTGGMLIRNTNDLSGALARVEEDIRGHYLLSYQPLNLNFDGEFRKIEVKVKREGLEVRSRKGYWAVPQGASLLSADEFRSLLDPAPRYQTSDRLPLFVQPAYFLAAGGEYEVLLTLEIPASDLKVQKEAGHSFVHLELVGLLQDETGNAVTSFRGPSRVQLRPGALGEETHLRLENAFQLSPGRYAILIEANDPLTARGTLYRGSLWLPDIESDETVLSSLVLAGAMTKDTIGDGEMTIDGVRISPSASRRFLNGEQLVFFLNLYQPGLSGQTADLDMTVSLFHAGRQVSESTERLNASEISPSPVPHLKVARYLTLEGLETGRYLLRTKFHDRVRDSMVSAQTTFEVANPDRRRNRD